MDYEFGKTVFGTKTEVVIEFTEDLLGPVPKSKDIYAKFVLSKMQKLEPTPTEKKAEDAAEAEEVQTVEDIEEGAWTGFHSDDVGLFVYNYWVKGFLKTSIEALVEANLLQKVPAYKKWIDRMIFIHPRRLHFVHNVQEPDGVLERPLRGMTRLGERILVTRSDLVKAGAKFRFTIELLENQKGLDWETLAMALDYGRYVGMGAWRGSGGYGQFDVRGFKEVNLGKEGVIVRNIQKRNAPLNAPKAKKKSVAEKRN